MPRTPLPAFGLYAITDTQACEERGVVECVRLAIAGGARIVQYRDKSNEHHRREREAGELLALCRQWAVPLIINDDLCLALRIGADGVHVGRDDGSIEHARDALSADAIVGASCYHEFSLARSASAAGASYVAFGRFFDSRTKPGRPLASPDLLALAKAELRIPTAAIGGIDAANAHGLVTAGANFLACIHSLFGQEDIESAARSIQARIRDAVGDQHPPPLAPHGDP